MAPVSLEISVGVMPDGTDELSLRNELDIIKPALLYGDRTVLYSPHILMLQHLDRQGSFTGNQLHDYLRAYTEGRDPLPGEDEMESFIQNLEQLQKKPHRTPEEESQVQHLIQLKDQFKKGYDREIRPQIERQLADVGYKQIRKAINEGLLTIAQLTDDKTLLRPWRDEELIQKYMDHLQKIMQKPGSYPLLDSFSVDVVRALVQDGRLPQSVIASKHGKQVGLASQLMRSAAPTFPKADVYDVIDIRKELRSPLIRFRSATTRLGELVESPVFGDEFEAEVNDLIIREIDPAILEIEEATQNNKYLKRLKYEVMSSTATLATPGLSIGVAAATDLPLLLSAAASAISGIAFSARAAHIALSTLKDKWEANEQIQHRDMYFLAEMNRRLQKPAGRHR